MNGKVRPFGEFRQVKAVLLGAAVILILGLIGSALGAALISCGKLGAGAAVWIAVIISVAAAINGGWVCGAVAGKARLPLSIAAGICYLIFVNLLRGILFRAPAGAFWQIPCCVLLGCALGALLSSCKRRKSGFR